MFTCRTMTVTIFLTTKMDSGVHPLYLMQNTCDSNLNTDKMSKHFVCSLKDTNTPNIKWLSCQTRRSKIRS